MLLNTYTAKGRAAARTLSTFDLRDEMRIVAGSCDRATITTNRGGRGTAYPVRVCRWLETFLQALPTAPADTALLEDAETVHICLYSTERGEYLSDFYWSADMGPVFRALVKHSQRCVRQTRRRIASLERRLREYEVAQLIYVASNGGEGGTV